MVYLAFKSNLCYRNIVYRPRRGNPMKKNRFLLHAAILLFFFTGCSKPLDPPPKIYPVLVTAPIQCDVPVYKEYVGHIEGLITIQVKSQISGNLVQQHFEEGQFV